MPKLLEIKDLWEEKYVDHTIEETNLDILNPEITCCCYCDRWNAVLYAVNSVGEIQRYYDDEEEYLEAIASNKKGGEENG